MPVPDSLLSVSGLRVSRQSTPILHGVDFEVNTGEVVVLVGRNGAGKTTTLRAVMGLGSVDRGQIFFRGSEITGLEPHRVAGRGIGYVPENRAIFPDLTVRENLELAQRQPGQLEETWPELLGLFPVLSELSSRPGGLLSGGQQQMVAIARSLVPRNHLLLVDETLEGLAPVVVGQIAESLATISQRATVVMVEQNLAVAARVAGRFVVIADGRTVYQGHTTELEADPRALDRWLTVS